MDREMCGVTSIRLSLKVSTKRRIPYSNCVTLAFSVGFQRHKHHGVQTERPSTDRRIRTMPFIRRRTLTVGSLRTSDSIRLHLTGTLRVHVPAQYGSLIGRFNLTVRGSQTTLRYLSRSGT